MAPPSKVLVSSVVRGASQGDSHGGLFLVDLERENYDRLLDWNDGSINFEGRGADRGLRGIVVVDDLIFIAASDELFAFDRKFRIVASWRNPYLKHCHEMSRAGGVIYLTSTGFNSILRFNLIERRFDLGLSIGYAGGAATARSFDPGAGGGPAPDMSLHLNNVHAEASGVYLSGLRLPALLRATSRGAEVFAEIPEGTHNARPFRGGLLLNDTDADCVVWHTPDRHLSMPVPRYPEERLLHAGADATGVARQAFGRGLCVLSDALIAGGSSPTTVAVYDLAAGKCVKSINLTMDVRHAAHGLAVWPF
jgi:hypothetical protein